MSADQWLLLFIPLLLALLGLYGLLVEPRRVKIKRKDYFLRNLPPGTVLKIIQLSDLHGRCRFDPIKDLAGWVEAEDPDLVAVTGDLVSRRRHIGPMVALLGSLSARLGIYFVAGNHDHAARGTGPGARWLKADLEKAGVKVLENSCCPLRLRVGNQELDFYLLGVDDPVSKKDRLGLAIARCWQREAPQPTGTPQSEKAPGALCLQQQRISDGASFHDLGVPARCRFTILLSHSPDVVDEAAARGISVVLAGHTHGGQICLPFLGAILTGSRFGRRFSGTEYWVGNTLLLINRGLGTTLLPVRLFCPPEISVYRFLGIENAKPV